jgi:hypothetical protein
MFGPHCQTRLGAARAWNAQRRKAADAGKPGTCRVCGCTDNMGCVDPATHETCHWVDAEHTLCSRCG